MIEQHIVGDYSHFKYPVIVHPADIGYEFYVTVPLRDFPPSLTPDLASNDLYWDVNMITASTAKEGYHTLQSIVNKRDTAFSKEMQGNDFAGMMSQKGFNDGLYGHVSDTYVIPPPHYSQYYILGFSTGALYLVTVLLDYRQAAVMGDERPVLAIHLPAIDTMETADHMTFLGGYVDNASLDEATTTHVWNEDFDDAHRRLNDKIQQYDKTLAASLRERDFIAAVEQSIS